MPHTTEPRALWIVKLGDTLPALRHTHGDFEDWMAQGLQHHQAQPHPVRVVDPRQGQPLPDLGHCTGIVVTGSHAMVTDRAPWSEATAAWLAQAVAREVPVLGICYGHQLLAHALGGEVANHPQGLEVGVAQVHTTPAAAQDALLGTLPATFAAPVAHRQSVRRLPIGAVALAHNAFEAHHAYRVGPCAWGVQFHPEFGPEAATAYVDHLADDLRAQGSDPAQLRQAVAPTPEAASLLARFATLVADRERTHRPAPASA